MDGLTECQRVMGRIYAEDPTYWPHGLTVPQHTDGLWLIREASTNKPAGFTGFQVFPEKGKRVGYYTVGVLPEYRHKGIAKQAVARLMQNKAREVDEIRAYVMSHNVPSLALARRLNVPIETMTQKSAADIIPGASDEEPVQLSDVSNALSFWIRRNPEKALALAAGIPLLSMHMKGNRQAHGDRERELDRLSVAGTKQAAGNPWAAFSDPDAPGAIEKYIQEPVRNWWNKYEPVRNDIANDPRSHTYARDLSLGGLGLMLLSRGKAKVPFFGKSIAARPLGAAALASVPGFRYADRKIDAYGKQMPSGRAEDVFFTGNPEDTRGLSERTMGALTRPNWMQWMVNHPIASTAAAAAVPIGGYMLYQNWKRKREQEAQRQRLMEIQMASAYNQQGGGGGFGAPMMTMPMMMPPMMLPMQKFSSEKQAVLSPATKDLLANLATFGGVGASASALFEGMTGDPVWKNPGEQQLWRAGGNVGLAGLSGLLLRMGHKGKSTALTSAGIAGILGTPIKDTALAATGASHAHQKGMKRLPGTILAGLLGGGGLVAGAHMLSKQKPVADSGKIRVTLPTRDPDDVETSIEMPFMPESVNLSRNVQDNLARDIRRRLRGEGRERTIRRMPRPQLQAV